MSYPYISFNQSLRITDKFQSFTKTTADLTASAERVLDVAGYIPVVGIVGGSIRAGIALAQAVQGVALFVLTSYMLLISEDIRPSDATKLYQDAHSIIRNSLFNFIRSDIEMTLGIGQVVCLAFDVFKSSFSKKTLGNLYGNNISSVETHRPFIAQYL